MTEADTLYLDLLKKCLTRTLFLERYLKLDRATWHRSRRIGRLVNRIFSRWGLELVIPVFPREEERALGRDFPTEAETMIGLRRLDNLQYCCTEVIRTNVPGDFLEAGVFRGGACIFMRAILRSLGVTDRTVWAADSFQGIPTPERCDNPVDRSGDPFWLFPFKVDRAEVEANFRRYDLMDAQVRFLEGWFSETLPRAPIEKLAVLRLDGDMYRSTTDALQSLYRKVSVGGFVIIDDYEIPNCRIAVEEFRKANGIEEEIHDIDGAGVFWQVTRS